MSRRYTRQGQAHLYLAVTGLFLLKKKRLFFGKRASADLFIKRQ
jgi:hypothetical protein